MLWLELARKMRMTGRMICFLICKRLQSESEAVIMLMWNPKDTGLRHRISFTTSQGSRRNETSYIKRRLCNLL